MIILPSRSNNRARATYRVFKADLLCEGKGDVVPGRGDRRSMSAAVRRTSGAESELEKGKIGRGQRVQT